MIGSHTFLFQVIINIATERLHLRNKHTTIGYRIALHIVVVTIAMCIVVIVESIGTQDLDEGSLLDLLLWDVSEIDTRGITLVLDIQAEFFFFYLRSEMIHVFHH